MTRRQTASWFIAAAVVLYFAVVVIDRFAYHRPAFMESVPVLDAGQWLLTGLLALSAAALVHGVLSFGGSTQIAALPAPLVPWSQTDRSAAVVSLAIHVMCTGLLLDSPFWFNQIVLEDGLVEWASALFWFVACLLTLQACLRVRHRGNAPLLQWLLLGGLAGLFFLCGMEEVSWFQRVFQVEAPEALARVNNQGELNLHNLATHPTENAFYNGMVVALVLIPALSALRVVDLDRWRLGLVVPRAHLVVVGTVAAGWNFNKWNIPLFQLALFVSLLIVLAVARRTADRFDKRLLHATAAVTLLAQAIFLIFGDHFVRIWDVTEYRELLLALGAMMYACNVFAASRRPQGDGSITPRVLVNVGANLPASPLDRRSQSD